MTMLLKDSTIITHLSKLLSFWSFSS